MVLDTRCRLDSVRGEALDELQADYKRPESLSRDAKGYDDCNLNQDQDQIEDRKVNYDLGYFFACKTLFLSFHAWQIISFCFIISFEGSLSLSLAHAYILAYVDRHGFFFFSLREVNK